MSMVVPRESFERLCEGLGSDGQSIPATYLEAVYLGLTTSHLVRLANGAEVMVRGISEGQPGARFAAGAEVEVAWRTADARLHTA